MVECRNGIANGEELVCKVMAATMLLRRPDAAYDVKFLIAAA